MTGTEKKSILIVEDDVSLCNSILTALHKNGYQAIGATQSQEATFRMKNQKFDGLIFDMRLGNLESGADLISFARERKDSLNRDTPIFVISGYLDKPLLEKIISSIQGALVKPFDIASLLNMLEKNIGG
jgi:CheY-like chemotaxis protein